MDAPPAELRDQTSRQLDAGFRGKTTQLERATNADARVSEIARLTLRMEEAQAEIRYCVSVVV